MQVAAERADQVVPRDLGLLLHLCVRQRIVEDGDLHRIRRQIIREVSLVRVGFGEYIADLQRLVDIERQRIVGVRLEVVEAVLVALERTLADAVGGHIGADVELFVIEVVGALLLGAEAVVVAFGLKAYPVVCAIAHACRLQLQAEEQAGVARVRVGRVDHLLEEIIVGERLDQLVLLGHRALAVLVGPLVELIVEVANGYDGEAVAGRDLDRTRRFFVRIVGVVVDEQVVAALVDLGGERVGQTGVELEYERVVAARQTRLLQRYDVAVGVVAGVELQTVQVGRMVEVGEGRRDIARIVLDVAADHGAVHVAHARLLLFGEVAARLRLPVHLELNEIVVGVVAHLGNVRLLQQLHIVVRVQRVDIAYGQCGEGRLAFDDQAIVGRHLELEVVHEAHGDQIEAEDCRAYEHEYPHDFEEEQLRAEDVRQAVDFDVVDALAQLLLDAHLLFDAAAATVAITQGGGHY